MKAQYYFRQLTRFCVTACFLLSPSFALCQDSTENQGPPTPENLERNYYQEGVLAQLWEGYCKASQEGDQEKTNQSYEEIREIRRKEGNPIMESLGFMFLQKAREEGSLDSREQARQDYLHAIQMNPYLWPAYVNLGYLKASESQNYKSYVSMYLKGIRLAFSTKNAYFLLKVIDWFLGHLIWALCFSFFIYFLVLSAKYTRPHLHIFLGDKGKSPLRVFIASALLFLPFLLGLNFYLIAGIYLVMFFPFFTPVEKRNTLIISLILVLMPFFLGIQASVKALQTDPEFRLKNRQFYLGDPQRQVEELTKLVKENPLDEYYFSLGVLEQKLGSYKEAVESYDSLNANSEYWAYGEVNRGNLLVLGQKFQEAISAYEKAARRNPNLVQAQYNLSSTYEIIGKHLEAEKAHLAAKSLDPIKVENWEMLGLSTAMVELGAPDSTSQFLKSIREKFSQVTLFSHPFYLPWIYFTLLIIASLAHTKMRNPRLIPLTCTKCGKVYYPSESPNSDWCSQCVHIYLLKSDLPSEAKVMKHDEVKKYNEKKNRIGFWSHLILPGAKSIINQAGITGWFSLVFWVLLLRFSFHSLTQITYPGMEYMVGSDLILYFIWGTTLIFWLIFGLRAAWQED